MIACNGKLETFEVYTRHLAAAKADMTGRWLGFQSRVSEVIVDGDRALITIETKGNLNLIRNRWKKYIIKDEPKTATQEPEQEKRGRGRPKK